MCERERYRQTDRLRVSEKGERVKKKMEGGLFIEEDRERKYIYIYIYILVSFHGEKYCFQSCSKNYD